MTDPTAPQTWDAIRPPPTGELLISDLLPSEQPSVEALLIKLLAEVRGLRSDITGLGHG